MPFRRRRGAQGFSRRLKKAVRGIDLACRYGGEEFVVVMPDTDIAMATMVAERLRRRIAAEPFPTTRTPGRCRRRFRSARRDAVIEDKPSDSSSAPTRRCIGPSAKAAPGRRRRRVSAVVRFNALTFDNH